MVKCFNKRSVVTVNRIKVVFISMVMMLPWL